MSGPRAAAFTPDGAFLLASREGAMVAEIRSPTLGSWYVHPAGDGLHAVRRIEARIVGPDKVAVGGHEEP